MSGIEERKEEVGMVLVLKRSRRAAMDTLVTDSMAQERLDLLPTHLPDAQIDVHLDLASEFHPQLLQKLVYETPFFLFSKNQILHNLNEFKKLFPESLIHYAIKANSEPEVLQTLADAQSNFEVASVYELHMLKKLTVPPQRIIYGTAVKPAAQIKEFFAYGVDRFAFDSLSELEKIAATAPGSRVYVRTRVNDADSVFAFSEKFGTEKENIVPLLLRAKELGLHPYGVSFHVGSQAHNAMAWANALEELIPVIKELQKADILVDVLNIGGGYPCQYATSRLVPHLEEIAANIFKQYNHLPYQPKLLLEPGRGIIANTGILIASVIARVERKGKTWLFLDAGVYTGLFEAMAYQGSTRYPITSMRSGGDAGEALFAIAGPTGDSPDIVTKEAVLPRDIQVGEKLIIHHVGAYSLVTACPFNGFPKPAVYYI